MSGEVDVTDYDDTDYDAIADAMEEAWSDYLGDDELGGDYDRDDGEPDFEGAGEDDGEFSGGGGSGGFGGGGGAGGGGPGGGGGRRGGNGGRQIRDLPTSIWVRAAIEFSGENRGTRASNFYGLDLQRVIPASRAASAAKVRAATARPLASYNRKGWRAQLRQLQRTAAGRGTLSGVGAAKTRAGWLTGAHRPSKANRDRIESAYHALRMRPVTQASAAARAANKTLTEELDHALTEAYEGAHIRLFDIEQIIFNP